MPGAVAETCKCRFEAEDVSKEAVFCQYYEGCLLWIDVAGEVDY